MLGTLVLVLLPLILYYLILKPGRYWRNLGVPQADLWTHICMNWFNIFKRQSAGTLVMKLYAQFPKERYYGFHQLNFPTLLIKDLDLVKQIMIKDFDSFMDRRFILPKDADPLFMGNLATVTDEDWKKMRSILSPTFTANKMRFLFKVINDYGSKFVEHFEDQDQDVLELEMLDVFTKFCNDVIASSIFGVDVNTFEDPENEFYVNGRNLTEFKETRKKIKFFMALVCPRFYKFLNLRFLDEKEVRFFTDLVMDSIKQRELKGIVRPDMIHLMMEARKESKNITMDNIVSNAVTFFFAGFDPISRLMCFALHELAENPGIQQKLREEISGALEICNGELSYDELMGMRYLDMVVSETLRKYPTQVATDRVCTKTFTIGPSPSDPDRPPLTIPIGTGISIPTFGFHRDPSLFPEPDRFDPERFRDVTVPYSYQPFGLGPRNCIGNRFALMEAKIGLFHVLDRFEVVPVGRTRVPLVLLRDMFSLSAEGGFWLGLRRVEGGREL